MSEVFNSNVYSTNKDEKAIAAEQRFQAQCFLITEMVKGVPQFINKRSKGAGNPYKFFSCVNSQGVAAASVVSSLTSIGSAQALFNLTSAELAHLVPQIRLFKVFEEPGKRNPLEREFKFNQGSFFKSENTDVGSILLSQGGRGDDIGIESVSFELLATQPAEITNNISCQVKLFFKNLSSLEKPLGQVIDGIPSVKPSDLILRPRTGNESADYQPEYYRVRLVVGWAIPNGVTFESEGRKRDLTEALKRSTTILNLTLKGHEFDFQMDGTTTLTIDYQAWVEGALSSASTDIFQPTEVDKIALQELRKELETEKEAAAAEQNFGQDTSGTKDSGGATAPKVPAAPKVELPPNVAEKGGSGSGEKTRIEEIETEIKEIEDRNAALRYKQLISLLTRGKDPAQMLYVDVPNEVVGKDSVGQKTRTAMSKQRCGDQAGSANYSGTNPKVDGPVNSFMSAIGVQGPAAGTTKDVSDAVNDAYDGGKLPDNLDGVQKAIDKLSVAPGGKFRIPYMFFGDILETALYMLDGHLAYKLSPASRITLLLGPCFISNPCDPGRYIAMNIADIPIAMPLFLNWFKTNVLDRKLKKYLLRNFINDLLGKLFGPALGSECFTNVRQTFRVHADVLNLRGTDANAPPLVKGRVYSAEQIREKVKTIDYSGGVNKKTHDYLLMYGYGLSPSHLKGNRFSDETLGIYHFDLGRDVGILKSIGFSKNDAPYLGEAKVLGKGDVAADLGGGAIYNSDMELVGNGLFVPGQYVYVNPRSLGLGTTNDPNSISNRIRLGGYYMVTKVSSDLAAGNFTTKISGIWETGGKVDPEPTSTANDGDNNNEPADWEGDAWSGDEAKAWAGPGFFGDENVEADPGDSNF